MGHKVVTCYWLLTLIHAGSVQQIRETEVLGLRVRSIGCDDFLQLLLELVRNDAERADRDLVVGNVLLLDVRSAGKLVKVVAWFHLRLNLAQYGGGRVYALLAETDTVRICLTLGTISRDLIHGGAVAMQGCRLRCHRSWRLGASACTLRVQSIVYPEAKESAADQDQYDGHHKQASFQLGATTPPVRVPAKTTTEKAMVSTHINLN